MEEGGLCLVFNLDRAITEATMERKCSKRASMVEGVVVSWQKRAASDVGTVRGGAYLTNRRPVEANLAAAAMVRTKSGMARELGSTNPIPPCLTAIWLICRTYGGTVSRWSRDLKKD